jgi:hypothetical protein
MCLEKCTVDERTKGFECLLCHVVNRKRTPILSKEDGSPGVALIWSGASMFPLPDVTSIQPLSNLARDFSRGDRRGIE